jgi:hypothetical protein
MTIFRMSVFLRYLFVVFAVIILGACNQNKQITSHQTISRAENWVVIVPETSAVSDELVNQHSPCVSDIEQHPDTDQKVKIDTKTEHDRHASGRVAVASRSNRNARALIKPALIGKASVAPAKDDYTYQWSSISLAISLLLGIAAAAFGGIVLYAAAGAFGLLGCILAYMYWLEQSDDHAWYTTLFLMLAGLVAGVGFLSVLF